MAKMTKKHYATTKARLTEERAATTSALATMQRQYEGKHITLEVSNEWNDLHDYDYDLRTELEALERAWSVRDWTAQDWQQWELVRNNCDERSPRCSPSRPSQLPTPSPARLASCPRPTPTGPGVNSAGCTSVH